MAIAAEDGEDFLYFCDWSFGGTNADTTGDVIAIPATLR